MPLYRALQEAAAVRSSDENFTVDVRPAHQVPELAVGFKPFQFIPLKQRAGLRKLFPFGGTYKSGHLSDRLLDLCSRLLIGDERHQARAPGGRLATWIPVATSSSMGRSRRLGPAPRRVLEDAFGAGVMDELPAGNQPLLHRHLAPGTEAIGNIVSGCCGS